MKTELGKITRAEVGKGGYDDAMFGVSFTLQGPGWGVQDFWKLDEGRLERLLLAAKKKYVSELTGVPIGADFDDVLHLTSWRVLEEVL